MPEAKRCPTCGTPLLLVTTPPGPEPADLEKVAPVKEGEADVSPVSLLASGSSDDTFVEVSCPTRPDSIEHNSLLDRHVTPSTAASVAKSIEEPSLKRPGTSSANFPTLNLDQNSKKNPDPRSSFERSGDATNSDDDIPEVHRTPWAMVLLASYASALTLAFAWTFLKDRSREKAPVEAKADADPGAVVLPGSARQAGLSRKVEPPEPIMDEHLAKFGRPLVIGSLEITPLDVKRQDVQLQRSNPYAPPARREGGKKALVLRLKLRNVTKDSVFAPLDQAYLRERGKEIVDTFIETANNERVYPFPLAVESEWSIVGQDFTELRPGESRTVSIASAPDAPPDSAGPFTWRVRLRTGINRTDTIGVVWAGDRPVPPKPKG